MELRGHFAGLNLRQGEWIVRDERRKCASALVYDVSQSRRDRQRCPTGETKKGACARPSTRAWHMLFFLLSACREGKPRLPHAASSGVWSPCNGPRHAHTSAHCIAPFTYPYHGVIDREARFVPTRPMGPMYKMSKEEAGWEADFPGDESAIPTLQIKFPPFSAKSVHPSVDLPILLRSTKVVNGVNVRTNQT